MSRRNIVLAVILGFAVLFPIWLFAPPSINTANQIPDSLEAIERGEYLLIAGGCISCHRGQTEETNEALSGGLALDTDFGTFYAPNITPDTETGIGNWQAEDLQWSRAKGSRTFNAVGPHLVTGLDYGNLDIEGRHNGVRTQGQNSSDMLFNINYMLHYISQYFTLYPGDLIWSGTMGTTQAMEPGDTYEVEVKGVGVLHNRVVQGM